MTRAEWIGIGILLVMGLSCLFLGEGLGGAVAFGGSAFVIWGKA